MAGHVEAYVCNELRLTVDQAKRTWHFWHEGTWALKFYTAEVRRLLVTRHHPVAHPQELTREQAALYD